MEATATHLRAHLYQLLDEVIASGESLFVRRGDAEIEIRARRVRSGRLARMTTFPDTVADIDAPIPAVWDEGAWRAAWSALAPVHAATPRSPMRVAETPPVGTTPASDRTSPAKKPAPRKRKRVH